MDALTHAFLSALVQNGGTGFRTQIPGGSDRAHDRARQRACKQGLVKFVRKPSAWHITDLGRQATDLNPGDRP